jgi:taurine dioxygenase
MAETFKVQRIAGALGAEIGGVNLTQELSGDLVVAIRQAFLEHLVIFFRGQDLTPAQFMRVAERFGEPVEYPMMKPIEGFPKIIQVAKYENERVNFGGVWHSDTSYLENPPMGTMLLAREVPPFGGDTLFANQYLAYETLSDGLKRTLDGLIGVNTSVGADALRTRLVGIRDAETPDTHKVFTAEHPVVRTHPETGRKSLYINYTHTARFADWSDEESRPLLHYLFQHQVRPEFTCRFSWQPGSLAFWDNRCAQHNPINDYHGHRRVMHRITLGGEKPR